LYTELTFIKAVINRI